jgi:predicted enzyme related to lactoylglutathione lyase
MEKPMLKKVAFTMYQVNDHERARGFYEKTLGLTRGLSAPNGVWTEYDLPGGGCLALFRHPGGGGEPGGGNCLAFEVEDLDALSTRLKSEGVVFRNDMIHGPACRMVTIADTEGNSIILHQLNKK